MHLSVFTTFCSSEFGFPPNIFDKSMQVIELVELEECTTVQGIVNREGGHELQMPSRRYIFRTSVHLHHCRAYSALASTLTVYTVSGEMRRQGRRLFSICPHMQRLKI